MNILRKHFPAGWAQALAALMLGVFGSASAADISASKCVYTFSTADISAYSCASGVSVDLRASVLSPLVTIGVALGPLPWVSGNAPNAYDYGPPPANTPPIPPNSQPSLASASVSNTTATLTLLGGSLGILGTLPGIVGALSSLIAPLGEILHTDVITVNAKSEVPSRDTVNAIATVNNTSIRIASLLTINATLVQSKAAVGHTCEQPTSETIITGLSINGINISLDPVLTSVLDLTTEPLVSGLLNSLGVGIKLNERVFTQDGIVVSSCDSTSRCRLATNAIHVSLLNVSVPGVATLNGDIIVSHSEAQLNSGCVERKSWRQIL